MWKPEKIFNFSSFEKGKKKKEKKRVIEVSKSSIRKLKNYDRIMTLLNRN